MAQIIFPGYENKLASLVKAKTANIFRKVSFRSQIAKFFNVS